MPPSVHLVGYYPIYGGRRYRFARRFAHSATVNFVRLNVVKQEVICAAVLLQIGGIFSRPKEVFNIEIISLSFKKTSFYA